jgi:acyl carrier protein
MIDLDQRLQRCFVAVFPHLTDGEIQKTSAATCAEWDSLALVTLIALVEEEFGIQVPVADLEHLLSFDAIHEYLQQQEAE